LKSPGSNAIIPTVNTRALIRGFVSDTFFVDSFGDSDSFLQTGIIDSTGMLELVAFVEQKFGIKLDDSELVPRNLDSLDNLCAFVERKVHGN
jgi:acyl carrier protein